MICVGIDVAKDKHDCFICNSEGESLNYFWTKVKNNNGTWTIRYSLLLKKIPKEYKDTEFNVRSAIVNLEN